MDIRYKGYIIEENRNLGIRKSRCDVELNIKEITLLSVEEAEKYLTPEQRAVGSWWWLRSPGNNPTRAAGVYRGGGSVSTNGSNVNISSGVRPALRIANLDSSNLSKGDIIKVGGESWTIISDNLALCDRVVGATCFRKIWNSPDANVYEKSDVKKWLDQWALERGIVTLENMELFHTR